VTSNRRHFEQFEPHTRLKHLIFDRYIPAWGMKILRWGRAGRRLAIVDAFAGRGRDDAGNDGSPVIAARRALDIVVGMKAAQEPVDADVRVYAIESRKSHFEVLLESIKPWNSRSAGLVKPLFGGLPDHIASICAEVGSAPAFFFLDPYGVKGLDASTYPKALAGRHNEMFVLCSKLGAVRLHGVLNAEYRDPEAAKTARLMNPSLFPEYDTEDADEAAAAATAANNALDTTVPAAREHLLRALGSEDRLDELSTVRQAARADTFVRLLCTALIEAGARFVVTIPIRDEKGKRVYSLVHASKSAVAFTTMKEAVSTALNKTELPPEVVARIEADLSLDVPTLADGLGQAFAAETIRWSGEGGLRELLLNGTAVFPFQCDEIKKLLVARGILQRIERKETCVFPPLANPGETA
jgi:three-Cys-motif partner protein